LASSWALDGGHFRLAWGRGGRGLRHAFELLDLFFELQLVLLHTQLRHLLPEPRDFILRRVFDAVAHALPGHRKRAEQQRDGGPKEKFHRVHAGDGGCGSGGCQRGRCSSRRRNRTIPAHATRGRLLFSASYKASERIWLSASIGPELSENSDDPSGDTTFHVVGSLTATYMINPAVDME
jgi:hypothetical protein